MSRSIALSSYAKPPTVQGCAWILGTSISIFFAASAVAQTLTIRTLAGGLTGGGYSDGPRDQARFSAPRGIARDSSGNFYVADSSNHVIRRVTASGDVTTVAGLGDAAGFSDGAGESARFRFPMGIAFDATTNTLLVADKDNHVIRRVTLGGIVTTVAGAPGIAGTANGTGSAARFTFPRGLSVDTNGTIFVADSLNHVIRRVSASAEVTTVAGIMRTRGSSDGFGSQATFDAPYGIAFDATTGTIYVSDTGNNTIRKVTPEGRVTTFAGSSSDQADDTDGTGTDARFDFPWGIDVDPAGNIYVADTGNHRIRKITPAAVVTTYAGTGARGPVDGDRTRGRFNSPSDVVVAPSGDLFVADGYNHVIRRVVASGVVSNFAGSMPSNGTGNGQASAARFNFPWGVAADQGGNIYVAESNTTIRKITAAGSVTTLAGEAGQPGAADGVAGAARFRNPFGLGVGPDGTVYVADTGNHTIRKVSPQGVVTTLAGVAGQAGDTDGSGVQARFNYPWGIAVDSRGNVYVADSYNHKIRLVEPAGFVTTFAGSRVAGSRDAVGASATFNYPLAVALDEARNIYVADWGNDTIRKITQTGVVTTIAGDASVASGWADGVGKAARFSGPSGIASDSAGNLFVSDEYNHAIRYITTAGAVVTVAGKPGVPGNVNGAGTVARFTFPEGLALSSSGQVVIADSDNHAIRAGEFAAPVIENFSAAPTLIKRGERSVLSFSVRDASSVSIDQGVGLVASSAQVAVTPGSTTTYTLTATGPGGTSRAQLTVYIAEGRRRAVRN